MITVMLCVTLQVPHDIGQAWHGAGQHADVLK